MIALIVAMRRYDRIIGIDGEIPWKIEGEQEQFKKLTKDNVVIMGRCTYEEIYKKLGRRSLPGRVNIVVSGSGSFSRDENAVITSSLEEAIKYANENYKGKNIYIAGGARLYNKALESGIVDTMYITYINQVKEKIGSDNIATFPVVMEDMWDVHDYVDGDEENKKASGKYKRYVYKKKANE